MTCNVATEKNITTWKPGCKLTLTGEEEGEEALRPIATLPAGHIHVISSPLGAGADIAPLLTNLISIIYLWFKNN